jgi:hypothetical protein
MRLATHLIRVIRHASPALQLALSINNSSIPHVGALSRPVQQTDVPILRDEQPLPRCSVRTTFLETERSPVAAESWAELDAEVGILETDRGGAGVEDELLERRGGMTYGAVMVYYKLSWIRGKRECGKAYTTRVCPADGCSLHGCQQSLSPEGDVHEIGFGDSPSLFRAMGEALPIATRQARRVVVMADASMMRDEGTFAERCPCCRFGSRKDGCPALGCISDSWDGCLHRKMSAYGYSRAYFYRIWEAQEELTILLT